MPAGRPTLMTPENIAKLKEAFSFGCTDREACLHADISEGAFYAYQAIHPEFKEEKELLKEKPLLAARAMVSSNIKKNVGVAQWYLERKNKKEFSLRTEVTGPDGESLKIEVIEDTTLKDANSSAGD